MAQSWSFLREQSQKENSGGFDPIWLNISKLVNSVLLRFVQQAKEVFGRNPKKYFCIRKFLLNVELIVIKPRSNLQIDHLKYLSLPTWCYKSSASEALIHLQPKSESKKKEAKLQYANSIP